MSTPSTKLPRASRKRQPAAPEIPAELAERVRRVFTPEERVAHALAAVPDHVADQCSHCGAAFNRALGFDVSDLCPACLARTSVSAACDESDLLTLLRDVDRALADVRDPEALKKAIGDMEIRERVREALS